MKAHPFFLVFVLLVAFCPPIVFSASVNEECTSVIITGTAAEGGWAILSKNRDAGDSVNKPVYYPRSSTFYSYTAVNWCWMGMNEKGLAVMNTAVGALGFGGAGLDNGGLNTEIMRRYDTVTQVCQALNDTASPIGPGKRQGGTCVGVIDRFGTGAFIEISGSGAYARFIVNGFDSEANHPRYYPGLASGPSGRDQYALDILNRIKTEKSRISYQDVIQRVTRYVHDKEQGSSLFSVSGEMANDGTVSSFVAISGDQRYEGKLNCFWTTYGNNPINGLYIPSVAWAGALPSITQTIYQAVATKKSYCNSGSGYDPVKVRAVQAYAFAAEVYTFQKYENLRATISGSLSDSAVQATLSNYINDAVSYAVAVYTSVQTTTTVSSVTSTFSSASTTTIVQQYGSITVQGIAGGQGASFQAWIDNSPDVVQVPSSGYTFADVLVGSHTVHAFFNGTPYAVAANVANQLTTIVPFNFDLPPPPTPPPPANPVGWLILTAVLVSGLIFAQTRKKNVQTRKKGVKR